MAAAIEIFGTLESGNWSQSSEYQEILFGEQWSASFGYEGTVLPRGDFLSSVTRYVVSSGLGLKILVARRQKAHSQL